MSQAARQRSETLCWSNESLIIVIFEMNDHSRFVEVRSFDLLICH